VSRLPACHPERRRPRDRRRRQAFERAACDAKILGSLDAATPERATASVTPRLREQVFARDHHRCMVPGCRSARNLDVHHIIEQAKGGPHEIWNLCLLCSGHHSALHAGLLALQGEAPYDLAFRWVYRPPLPIGLDPVARDAMIRQRIEEIFTELEPASPVDAPEIGRPSRDSEAVEMTGPPKSAPRRCFPPGRRGS
jgi:5-methylcytosine-specific restriction endonuclease McrA